MSTGLVKGSLADLAGTANLSLAESFLNVDAVLLVDMSGSMGVHDARGGRSRYDAAEDELRTLQAQFPGKVAVIAFSDQAEFCPTGVPIRMGGNTNLAAALRFVKPVDGLARVIVISDGEPDSESEALSVARTFTSRIDVVYIGPEIGGSGREFLERLAKASGGTFVSSDAPGLLADSVTLLLQASA